MFNLKPLLLVLLISTLRLMSRDDVALAAEEPSANGTIQYEVEDEDELGKIIQKFNGTPLWGPRGLVKKVIQLNPGKIRRNGDLIYPRGVIVLPLKPIAPPPQATPVAAVPELAPSTIVATPADVTINEFNITPFLQFSKYDLKDRTTAAAVSLASSLGTGLQLNWQQSRNYRWGYSLHFSVLNMAFSNSSTGAAPTLAQPSKITFNGGAGIFRILPFWQLKLGLNAGAGKSYFLQRLDAQTLILRQALVPYAGLNFELPLWRAEAFEFLTHGGARCLFPSRVQGEAIKWGHLENLGLSTLYHFKKHWTLGVDAFGNYAFQRTALSDYVKIDVGLGASFGILF